MLIHKLVRGWVGTGATISKTVAVSGGAEINVDAVVPGLPASEATDYQLDVDVESDHIQNIFITSDREVDIKLNDATTPPFKITLKPDSVYAWNIADPLPIADSDGTEITGTISSLYITNKTVAPTPPPTGPAPSAPDANVQIRILYDPVVLPG